jgi:hypothetical protein
MTEKIFPLEYKGLKIDPVIFTQGFVPACNIGICGGECCDWGVYMDRDFKDVLTKFEKEIQDVMDENQIKDSSEWYEKDIEVDSDFPSGFAIGTETYTTKSGNEQCVFKDSNGFCSIQVMAMKNNMHKWAVKPKYCIMYPLTIVDNILTYDEEHSAKLHYCGINHEDNFVQTVFDAMKEELIFVLGIDCYNFLNDYYEKNYKSLNKKPHLPRHDEHHQIIKISEIKRLDIANQKKDNIFHKKNLKEYE